MRLQNADDCRQIVECFLRRGMEFQESRPGTAARPGTANTRPMTSSSQDRPLMMQTGSPYFSTSHSPSKPSPFSQQGVFEAGSLSNHYAASPRAPTRGIEVDYVARQMPPPTFFNRDTVALPRDLIPERPTASQLYRAYTTPSEQSRSQFDIPDIACPAAPATVERRSSMSQITDLEAIRTAVEQDANPMMHGIPAFAEPTLQDPKSNSGGSSTFPLPSTTFFSSDPTQPRPQSARPSTAATTSYPDTLEHEMPPRRELPNYRAGTSSNAKGGSDNSSSRPQSALELPPLPVPTVKKAGSATSRTGSSTSPVKKLGPLRPSVASSTKKSTAEEPSGRPGTVAGVVNQHPDPEKPSTRQTSPQTTKPKSMNELLYGQKTLTERSPNSNKVPRVNSLADAPHEVVSPPVTAESSPTKTANPPVIGALSTQHPDAASLQGYAEQSPPDRQTMMEEFFASNWENEDFIALCDDVENCWRRIALGL